MIFGKFLNIKKYIIYGVLVAVLIVSVIFVFNNSKKATDQTIVVSPMDFINKVSVSGKVVATAEVDLSFKNAGLIERIFFTVGQGQNQIIKAGTLIAKIDTKDAEKIVHDAEIDLESAKLSLAKLKLESSNENMNADLMKAYEDGFNAVADAFLDLTSIIVGLEDTLNDDNLSDNAARTSGNTAQSYRSLAETAYYTAKSSFEEVRKQYRILNNKSSREDIDNIIKEMRVTTKLFSEAAKNTKNFIDYMKDDSNNGATFSSFQTTLSTYTNTINEHLSTLLSVQTSIKNYKDAFPSASLDIQDSILTIKQKENALQDAKNKLSDYYIRAPFDGVITKIDAKVGEIATPNTPLITMMSANIFQIESFMPEVNIAQIKLGDEASVTLDAYGETVSFNAKIISIDPAETVRDGVSTYRIKLQFSEKDDRIKSGMTANVAIVTFNKPNVIVVPGSAIFERDGKKFVQVKREATISNQEVILGSVSSLGQTEIISGLESGDLVLVNGPVSFDSPYFLLE